MKYSNILVIIQTLVSCSKCLSTDSMRHSEVTISSLEINTHNINDDRKETLKPETSEKKTIGIYLEDVLYTLKYQNWTDDEMPCLNQTLRMLRSLQNFTLWAVWEWDSITSEPQGLLFGNKYQLGNFDECMNPPWARAHPDLRTQYCLADIVLKRTDSVPRRPGDKIFEPYGLALDFIQSRSDYSRPLNELTWGACAAAACSPRSVERLVATLLARSHLGAVGLRPRIHVDRCQRADEPKNYDLLFYSFIGLAVFLLLVALLCTYWNNRYKGSHPSFKSEVINAFCLKHNASDLLTMKKGEDTEVLYGIRFLTMVLIVLDHQIGIFNSGPISNGVQVDKDALSVAGLLLLHDDLFVDSFFLLSGFLFATSVAKLKRMTNPFLLILRRYVRLVSAFAMVVFYMCAVFAHTGSGPLWPTAVVAETDPCRSNWWINLLMFNNYYRSEDICMVVTWYISCDFHFFTVTVFTFWLYRRCSQLGLLLGGALSVASLVVPGVINFIYHLPAVQLFTYEFVRNPRASDQFHLTYIKSHTRFAAYLVGFFSGYAFVLYKSSGNVKKICQRWSTLGALTGLTIMLAVMVTGVTFLWRSYHPIESAVYAALNRPAWAIGLVLVVFCCAFGYVPVVKKFLSWYPWAPLSRLAYGIYLTHSIIISRNVFVSRGPQVNDYLTLLTAAFGVLVWSSIAALLLFLFVEAPANNLFALCIKKRSKPHEETNTGANIEEPSASTSSKTSQYLEHNLPSTVYLSSKI